MFKFLRSKAKIFYWVIAVSFILFIFLAWGMDFQGSQRTRDVRADALGSVNGYAISSRDWDNAYQSQLGQMRQRNPDQPLSADQAARAAEQVWNNLVRDRLVEAEIQRLGLIATDDEILDILKNDPPPALLANYKDDDGVPDLAAYLADLSNPARDWTGVENYLRVIIPRQKLQQLIVAPAVVTDAEVREAFVRQTGQAVAEYIGVIYGESDSTRSTTTTSTC